MGIFQKLFGRTKKEDNGPMPSRNLKLQCPPTPENGINFSEQFRDAVKTIENIELDFSIESLEFVDNFLQRFRNDGLSVDDFAETVFIAGCYVGQVMVHHNQGIWIKQEDANLPPGVNAFGN